MKKIGGKCLWSLLLSATLFMVSCTSPKSDSELRFNDDGKFKILQFSDIHWDHRSSTAAETADVLNAVVAKESPDLIILTGDVVTYPPGNKGWEDIAKLFGSMDTPWCVVMGNHDGEDDYHGMSKEKIFSYLSSKPGYVGEVGEDMTGCGNFVLEVVGSSSDDVKALLYCMDSNDYPADQKLGKYDWFHFDQIAWYRATGDEYRKLNGGEPLPSLMFFHIPLEESARVPGMTTTVGNQRERIPQGINSGMFANMLMQGDVIGTFSGHDHDNDFAGIYKDILISYCRVSGTNAYGELARGGRVIELYEGERKFDTWISTPETTEFLYYYPSGLSQDNELTMSYLPAVDVNPKRNGVHYKYFEGGRLKHTDHLYTKAKMKKSGVIKNFSLAPAEAPDSMGFEYNAYVDIPERGVYRFFTISDDGSKLFIDGNLVVDNDGSHGSRREEGLVALEKGFHKIKVLYFEDYMGEQLEVGVVSRNIPEMLIPDGMLYVDQ